MELFIKFAEPAFKLILLVAAVSWWFFHSRTRARKLERDLEIAKSDLEFLLQVEHEYGEECRFHEGSSLKNQVRSLVKSKGYTWSGKFTKGKIQVSKKVTVKDNKFDVIEKLLK